MSKLNLDKLKSFAKEKKGLTLLIGCAVALGVYLVLDSTSTKPSPTSSSSSKPMQLSSPKENLVGVALDASKKSDSGLPPGVGPAPNLTTPPPNIISTGPTPGSQSSTTTTPTSGATTTTTPITTQAPQVEATGKPTSALQRLRMLYYNSVSEAISAAANPTAQSISWSTPKTTTSETPGNLSQSSTQPTTDVITTTTTTSTKPKQLEFIVPGTTLDIVLVSGAIVTSNRDSKLLGIITKVAGPRGSSKNFSGCMALGTAKLDDFTTRVYPVITTISCPGKQVSITSYARGRDYAEGIKGRYYSRVTERLLLSLLPSFGQSYYKAKLEALQQTSTAVSEGVVTQTTNVPDPNLYAISSAFDAGFTALQTELESYKTKLISVNVIDPGTRVTFIVESLATVQNLYEVSN